MCRLRSPCRIRRACSAQARHCGSGDRQKPDADGNIQQREIRHDSGTRKRERPRKIRRISPAGDTPLEEAQEEEKRSHQETQRQSVASAQRKEIEEIGIEIQQQQSAERNQRAREAPQDKDAEPEVERVPKQIRQSKRELRSSCNDVAEFSEDGIEKMICCDLEIEEGEQVCVEDRRSGDVDVPDV